jgi:hypothetical protein
MKHKHAELMAAYAADAMTTDKPWELWESRDSLLGEARFGQMTHPISWLPHIEYRRKPQAGHNSQVACELLGKAYDALEKHSAIICEPNVDHIQRMVWDAMKLIQEPKQHTIVLTTAQLKEVVMACDYPSWENEDFQSARTILNNTLKGEQV